jgi:hypothetical protein
VTLNDYKSNAAASLRNYARLLSASPASLVSEVDYARKRAAEDVNDLVYAKARAEQDPSADIVRHQLLLNGHVVSVDSMRWANEYAPDPAALALAHEINAGSTERGRAIRAHLTTMGWMAP